MVQTRNAEVTKELSQLYKQAQHVFCVSNKLWWDHREDHLRDASPWLELSGIISFRRHCIGLVAAHQMQDASIFMRERIPALVSAVDLWVQSGSGRIADEAREQISKASEEAEHILQRVSAMGRTYPIASS